MSNTLASAFVILQDDEPAAVLFNDSEGWVVHRVTDEHDKGHERYEIGQPGLPAHRAFLVACDELQLP